MSGKPHVPRELIADKDITPKEAMHRKMMRAEKLSKPSCCCGATASNPCVCMKAPEPMQCSATEPKCACYEALEKNAESEDEELERLRRIVGNLPDNICRCCGDAKWTGDGTDFMCVFCEEMKDCDYCNTSEDEMNAEMDDSSFRDEVTEIAWGDMTDREPFDDEETIDKLYEYAMKSYAFDEGLSNKELSVIWKGAEGDFASEDSKYPITRGIFWGGVFGLTLPWVIDQIKNRKNKEE